MTWRATSARPWLEESGEEAEVEDEVEQKPRLREAADDFVSEQDTSSMSTSKSDSALTKRPSVAKPKAATATVMAKKEVEVEEVAEEEEAEEESASGGAAALNQLRDAATKAGAYTGPLLDST